MMGNTSIYMYIQVLLRNSAEMHHLDIDDDIVETMRHKDGDKKIYNDLGSIGNRVPPERWTLIITSRLTSPPPPQGPKAGQVTPSHH